MIAAEPRSEHRTRPPSLAVRAKALRLLARGGVEVLERTPRRDVIEVQGEHGVYLVTRQGDEVRCSCAARRPCSHLIAALVAAGRPV